MNNKGFTLIELLAVIVILAMLALLSTTAVTKLVKDAKNDLNDVQIASIKASAEAWGAENLDKLPESGDCAYITLSDIKDSGLLDDNVKDLKTNQKTSDDLKIKITGKNNDNGKLIYNYEVNPENVDGCINIGLAPGLYDENDNLVASWDELVNTYGLDIEKDQNSLTTGENYGSANYVFQFYQELKVGIKMVIPETITKIGRGSFLSTQLTSIIIPSTVTSIGSNAFTFCNLETVTIPSSVTSIAEGAFGRCSKLKFIKVSKFNPAYNSGNNANAIIETATNKLIRGCKSTIIPEGITSIGNSAFSSIGLTNITIPSSVTEIKFDAFSDNEQLTTINYSGTATGSPWGATNATVVTDY